MSYSASIVPVKKGEILSPGFLVHGDAPAPHGAPDVAVVLRVFEHRGAIAYRRATEDAQPRLAVCRRPSAADHRAPSHCPARTYCTSPPSSLEVVAGAGQ